MENNKKEMGPEEMEAVSGGFDRSLSKMEEKSEDGGIIRKVVDLIKGLFD